MRAHTLSLVIVSALIVSSAHPSTAASIEGYEVQAGAASSSFQGDLHDDFDQSLRSITGGVALRIRCNRVVSFQPELRWVQKGGGTGPITFSSGPDAFTFPSIEWVVDYVDVPLIARFDIPASGVVHPYLLAGSGLEFKLGGEVRGAGFVTLPYSALRYARIFEGLSYSGRNVIDSFRDIDLDATLGLGFGIGRGANRVTLEARWIEGLLDPSPQSANVSAHNRALTATLGYAWR